MTITTRDRAGARSALAIARSAEEGRLEHNIDGCKGLGHWAILLGALGQREELLLGDTRYARLQIERDGLDETKPLLLVEGTTVAEVLSSVGTCPAPLSMNERAIA